MFWRISALKKLCSAIDRFAYKHPNFGVPNLMKYIVIGNALIYLLSVFSSPAAVSFLAFDWAAICRGAIWRLVTFFLMPGYYTLSDGLWMVLFLYFYHFIGSILEREWGTAKFTLYYFSGVLFTALGGIIGSLLSGYSLMIVGAQYVNLSMFFAFAALYPNTQVLFMMIIPVKMKWLALLDGAFFAVGIIQSLLWGHVAGWVTPLIAIANFLVFFWNDLTGTVNRQRNFVRHKNSHQTIQFKKAAEAQQRKSWEQGYRHKCSVCGRTDASHPDLQFRYCSRCAGYHCFCEEHIFNHVHFTEE
jgi:hypothetical protein